MDILRLTAEHGGAYLEIVEEANDAFYLFRYVGGRVTHDHYQRDLDMAMRCGRNEHGVPMDAWRTPPVGQSPLSEQ